MAEPSHLLSELKIQRVLRSAVPSPASNPVLPDKKKNPELTGLIQK
jgi:hypothetical protein